jgi:hypothetical protein
MTDSVTLVYTMSIGFRSKEFLKFAFADGRCEASCPCSRCENRRMLSKYEMSAHLANLCRTTFCDTNMRRCGLR